MTKFTHNNLSARDEVSLTGCNGKWTIVEILDGYRGIQVKPEDGGEPIWIDVSEVTKIVSKYKD